MYLNFNSIDEFKEAKRKLWKYNKIWKKYSARRYVGDCSYLYKKLKPISYQDFYEKYTIDGEANKGKETTLRGRTKEEIYEIAKQYQNECDNTIDIEVYVKNIYMHVIIETYDGQRIENELINRIHIEQGITLIQSYGDDDAKMGIDMRNKKYALQIKPISFFRSNKNVSLIEDRANAFVKKDKCYQTYNINTYYIIYDIIDDKSYKLYCHDNGKITFHLEELCYKNGIVDENIYKNLKFKIQTYL